MKIQSHKLRNYGKESAFGNFVSNQFGEQQKPAEPIAEQSPPKQVKLELPAEDCLLSQHKVSRANKKHSHEQGYTGWAKKPETLDKSSIDDMIKRLRKTRDK